jgi:hypothetical protein
VRLDDKYPGFPVFNLDHLKPYMESPPSLGKRNRLPATRDKVMSEEYEVEKIVAKKYDKRRKTHLWLVRWKTYRPQHKYLADDEGFMQRA